MGWNVYFDDWNYIIIISQRIVNINNYLVKSRSLNEKTGNQEATSNHQMFEYMSNDKINNYYKMHILYT